MSNSEIITTSIPRKSISRLTYDLLRKRPALVHELQRREKTQREVAQELVKELKELYPGLKVTDGAVAVALTRYLKKMREYQETHLGTRHVINVLKKSTTSVIDGLKQVRINFGSYIDNKEHISKFIIDLFEFLEDESIANVFLIRDGIELYVQKLAENELSELISNYNLEYEIIGQNLSLLKLILPIEAREVPGILAHVSSLLADQAISIFDTQTYLIRDRMIITFVVSEGNATKARDLLRKVIT